MKLYKKLGIVCALIGMLCTVYGCAGKTESLRNDNFSYVTSFSKGVESSLTTADAEVENKVTSAEETVQTTVEEGIITTEVTDIVESEESEESEEESTESDEATLCANVEVAKDMFFYIPPEILTSEVSVKDYLAFASSCGTDDYMEMQSLSAINGYLSYESTGGIFGNEQCMIILSQLSSSLDLAKSRASTLVDARLSICDVDLEGFSCGAKLSEFEDAYLYRGVYAVSSSINTEVDGRCVLLYNKTTGTLWLGIYAVYTQSDTKLDAKTMCEYATVSKDITPDLIFDYAGVDE